MESGLASLFGAPGFGGDQLRAQLIGEVRNDLILHVEQIGHRLVEPVRPQMIAGDRVDELHVDAHSAAAALNAALENIANVQFASDLLGVDRLAFVGEGGVARDDEGVGDARKVGRQAFRDSVDEMFVLGVAAKTGEGQHHDRQARRRRRVGRRGDCGSGLACAPAPTSSE